MPKNIIKLSEIVQYQSGAIVSKEIARKPTGTVTAFAFANGQGLSEHTAPFDAIVQILDGQAKITISGEEHILSAGEIIVMPANEPHSLTSLSDFKMLLTMIKS